MTESGRVVLLCDDMGQVWLHPARVSFGTEIWARAPGWVVGEGVHVTPGTTRWATVDEIPDDWWAAVADDQ